MAYHAKAARFTRYYGERKPGKILMPCVLIPPPNWLTSRPAACRETPAFPTKKGILPIYEQTKAEYAKLQ